MSDENDKPPRVPKGERNLQRIHQLYEFADRIYGGLEEPGGPTFEGSRAGHDDAPESGTDASDSAEELETEMQHAWVVHVLSDLTEYAKENNLGPVHDCLSETLSRVIALLREHADDKS